jgi:hypothetical protein
MNKKQLTSTLLAHCLATTYPNPPAAPDGYTTYYLERSNVKAR